ncbi:DUF445 domain-containing protein [Sphingomonas panacisoli]|uniref:DUF445 domain-containing protein n=1 Tax=Sphingomonas panacisoli TaxID=1813879 RepID=A0A5B8LMB8_9SPHN|nr:DUF445 domain-containing protein [Sphingomonas panacisoli]QDZ09263.1 DUF445 domain-containing protein [Sphingomonas panacisoli]
MRIVATALLLAMAALFLIARALGDQHPAWGFVRAFAEAAMVGGLADWFAVTALFRHPLGLPIPHTAIVPRNKDRIGDTLANFLRDNFLIPRVVARRMQRLDVAGAAGRWLANPKGATEGRLRRGASRLAADMLESLDQERLGGMVRTTLAQRLRALEVSPLLGNALAAAIAENRHIPLLDGIVKWSAKVLEANEPVIRAMVHERAGSLMRFTGLDETLANKIIAGLDGMIRDMAADPDHPLRAKADEGLAQLAHDLQHDPAMQARVEGFKAEMLDNPALSDWWQGIWEQMRGAMLKIARDPDSMMAGRFGEALRQLGTTLQEDPELAATINRFARRAAVGTAADYGDAIVRLVSETVRGWDAQTITRRLENAVGRDLQYIRINGTLVGGLVGVAIHTIDVAF